MDLNMKGQRMVLHKFLFQDQQIWADMKVDTYVESSQQSKVMDNNSHKI